MNMSANSALEPIPVTSVTTLSESMPCSVCKDEIKPATRDRFFLVISNKTKEQFIICSGICMGEYLMHLAFK